MSAVAAESINPELNSHRELQESIAGLIHDYVVRGVFRAAEVKATRKGIVQFNLVWFQDQPMGLTLDARHKLVTLVDVLPSVTPRSSLDRQLRAWLRDRAAAALPPHRRLDPALFTANLSNRKGRMQLRIKSRNGDLVSACRKLVQLVNELYLDFLSAPERYDWIVETFELDPDNPRWP